MANEIKSAIIGRAGGSWNYEDLRGQTLWTQTNSIEVKNSFIIKILSPLLKLIFTWQTKQAMKNAKKILEKM